MVYFSINHNGDKETKWKIIKEAISAAASSKVGKPVKTTVPHPIVSFPDANIECGCVRKGWFRVTEKK